MIKLYAYSYGKKTNHQKYNKFCTEFSGALSVRKQIIDDYSTRRQKLNKELETVDSRFSITADMWKASSRKQSYLVITLHWIDLEWKLCNVILDFRYIPKKHSGEHIKDAVMDTLKDYRIAHRILGVTTDGASNMEKFFDLMLPEMESEKRNFARISPEGSFIQTFYCCHMNIIYYHETIGQFFSNFVCQWNLSTILFLS